MFPPAKADLYGSTLEMILDFYGFSRIFNILARGYLFHDADGNLLKGDPYDRIDRARNAVFAGHLDKRQTL